MKGIRILALKEITMCIFTKSINKTKLLEEIVGERPQINLSKQCKTTKII